jgi:hypothetical protein
VTGVLLVSIYIVGLTLFLGLDIIAKVPPTLYALVLAGLGAVAAVSLVGGQKLGASAEDTTRWFVMGAAFLGAFAAAAGAGCVTRFLRAFERKGR